MAKPRPDAIAALGALVVVTSRLRLGVGCMASFALRDPLVFALQWARSICFLAAACNWQSAPASASVARARARARFGVYAIANGVRRCARRLKSVVASGAPRM
jgi:hypothetical protein